MKNVLFFLLGLILMVGVSATTVSVMTIKPATPVTTVAFTESSTEAPAKILNYSNKGFVVVDMAGVGSGSYRQVTVVMARY